MKANIHKDCEVIYQGPHLEVLSPDELHGAGCDLVVFDHGAKAIYIVECKGGDIGLDDLNDAKDQVKECRELVRKKTCSNPTNYRTEGYLVKQGSKRVHSHVPKELSKEGIAIVDSPLRIPPGAGSRN